MPATSASSPIPRIRRRRLLAPLLTLLAAIAGLATGRLVGQPGSELLVIALIVTVGSCAAVAWIAAHPGADVLTATAHQAFRAELDRARRHRRTFAMARLELAATSDGTVLPEGDDGIAGATIRLIGASLRITDRAWLEDGDAVILLPESDRATAESFAERVRAAAPGRFTDRIAYAAFPDDGLTSSALLDALERGMRGSPMPSPIVRTTVADGAVDLATAVPTINDQVESEIG
jgi:hypothetical protein